MRESSLFLATKFGKYATTFRHVVFCVMPPYGGIQGKYIVCVSEVKTLAEQSALVGKSTGFQLPLE
jgi:hypothetical protein